MHTNLPRCEFYEAAYYGKLDTLKQLIASGKFNVNTRITRYDDLRTALHWAADYNYLDIATWLLDNHADINVRENKWKFTPLHLATRHNYSKMVEFLISRGANINVTSIEDLTPLYFAISKMNLETVKLLISSGADLTIKHKEGKTYLDLAKQFYNEEIILVLEQAEHNKGISISSTATIKEAIVSPAVEHLSNNPVAKRVKKFPKKDLNTLKLNMPSKTHVNMIKLMSEDHSDDDNDDYDQAIDAVLRNELWHQGIDLSLKCLTRNPDFHLFFRAHHNLTTFYQRLDNFSEAMNHVNIILDKVNSIAIENKDFYLSIAYCEKGKIHKATKDLKNAGYFLIMAVKSDTTNYFAYNSLGVLKELENNFYLAKSYYEKAIEANPRYSTAYNNLGRAYFLLPNLENNIQQAFKNYNLAIDLAPNNGLFYYNRANLKQYLLDLPGAETDFLKAVELAPNNENFLLGMGLYYLHNAQIDKAIPYFNIVKKLNPNNLVALCSFGNINLLKDEFDDAIVNFARGLESKIPEVLLSFQINQIAAEIGLLHYEEALTLLDKIIKNNVPDQFKKYIYQTIGNTFVDLNCYEEAINTYEELLEVCNDHKEKARIKILLGHLQFDTEHYSKAIEHYQQAIPLDPALNNEIKNLIEETRTIESNVSLNSQSRVMQQKIMIPAVIIQHANDLTQVARGKNVRSSDNNFYFKPLARDDLHQKELQKKLYKLIKNENDGKWYMKRINNKYSNSQGIASNNQIYNFILWKNPHNSGQPEINIGLLPHYALARGKEVLYAGGIYLRNGEIIHWNNCSGHYTPIRGWETIQKISSLTGFPVERYFPLEPLKARLLKALANANQNFKVAASSILDLTKNNPDVVADYASYTH